MILMLLKKKFKEDLKNKMKKEKSLNLYFNNINHSSVANNLYKSNSNINGINIYSINIQKYNLLNKNK